MIICICNNIRSQDLKDNPELKDMIGSVCGKCLITTDDKKEIRRSE